MKYAIIKVVNGSFAIHAEGFTALDKAKVNYHSACQTLWNDKNVLTACVMLVNEELEIVSGYKEIIYHNEES